MPIIQNFACRLLNTYEGFSGKMKVHEFIENLIATKDIKVETIDSVYHRFLFEFEKEVLNYDKECVRKNLTELPREEFVSLGIKLGRCFTVCKKNWENLASEDQTTYAQNVKKVYVLIKEITSIYYEIAEKPPVKNDFAYDNIESVFEQHFEYLVEIQKKLQEKMNEVDEVVAEANKMMDEKIFSLLTNTISILGIFVTIAFTGFSVTTLFSNIDFSQASSSQGNFLKSVFFLFLISWLSYNLLLLLIYFIYKLSRPLTIMIKRDKSRNETQESFTRITKLTYFLWMDVIMFVLTIGLFVWCLFL